MLTRMQMKVRPRELAAGISHRGTKRRLHQIGDQEKGPRKVTPTPPPFTSRFSRFLTGIQPPLSSAVRLNGSGTH